MSKRNSVIASATETVSYCLYRLSNLMATGDRKLLIEANRTLQDLEDKQTICIQALTHSVDTENVLEGQWQRLIEDPDPHGQSKPLQDKLAVQRLSTARLGEELASLEIEVERAYRIREERVMRSKHYLATKKKTEDLLRKTHFEPARVMLEKIDKELTAREALEADRSSPRILEQFSNSELEKLDVPELENASELFADAIKKLSGALAQMIATQHQLDQQLMKNREQVQTWNERATLALQQGNKGDEQLAENLAAQARQRGKHYFDAAELLDGQLEKHKQSIISLTQLFEEHQFVSDKIATRLCQLNQHSQQQ